MSELSTKSRNFEESDWKEYVGAEIWNEGELPIIRETEEYVVIGDKNGITVLFENGERPYCYFRNNSKPFTQLVVDNLPEKELEKALEGLGFEATYLFLGIDS